MGPARESRVPTTDSIRAALRNPQECTKGDLERALSCPARCPHFTAETSQEQRVVLKPEV